MGQITEGKSPQSQIIYFIYEFEAYIHFMITLFSAVSRLQGLAQRSYNKLLRFNFSIDPPKSKQRLSPSVLTTNRSNGVDPSRPIQSQPQERSQKAERKSIVLSPEAQRAVWASNVILAICSAQAPTSMSDRLQDKILGVRIDQSGLDFNFELKDSYRDEILACLTEGIQIDQKVYKQSRIKKATTQSLFDQLKLVFWPTTTASTPVFNCLLSRYDYIVLGSSGIGKTISLVFYIHLTSYINKLSYLSYAPWIPEEKRESFKSELILLRKSKILVAASKCWYISINKTFNEEQAYFIQSVKSQTKEMCLSEQYQERVNKCKNLNELVVFLYEIQPSQISSTIVIDQINSLTSYFRNWNSSLEDYARLIKQQKKDQARQLLQKRKILYYQPANAVHKLILKMAELGGNFILNSSLMIEQELLRFNPQLGLSLKLLDHGDPYQLKVSYSKKVQDKAAQIEFNHFFQQSLLAFCKTQKALQTNIKKINQKFLLNKVINVKTYFRPLFIRQYLVPPDLLIDNQKPLLPQQAQILEQMKQQNLILMAWMKKLSQPLEDKQIDQFLSYLDVKFSQFCLQKSRIKLIQFIGQGVDDYVKAFKRLIISTIRSKAQKVKDYQKQQRLIVKEISIELGHTQNVKQLYQRIFS